MNSLLADPITTIQYPILSTHTNTNIIWNLQILRFSCSFSELLKVCYFKRFDKYDAWCTTFKGLDLLAEQTWSAVKESAFAGCNQCIVVPTTRSNCNKIKNIQCNARTSIQMQLVRPVHLLASFEREPIFLPFQPLSCDMRLGMNECVLTASLFLSSARSS